MTLSLLLGEDLVDAVVAKLQTNMTSRISSLNAQKADTLPLVAPTLFAGRPNQIPQTPAIIVSEGETPRFEFEGSHGFIPHTLVWVTVLDEDQDPQRLSRKLQRWVRIVVECLWDSEPQQMLSTATFTAFSITPYRIIPGPTDKPLSADVGWRSFKTVVFLTKHIEGL